MILVCHFLLKNTKINGITLYPFVLLKNSEDKKNLILLNHERIHLRQQLELLIVFFYFWYLAEYLYYLVKFTNSSIAYHRISFEREAYQNETNLDYLIKRRMWRFLTYIKK